MYKKIRITGEVLSDELKIGRVVDALICPLSGHAWTLIQINGWTSYSTFWIDTGNFKVVKEKKPETTAEVISEGKAPTNNILLPAHVLKILTVEFK